MTDSGNLNCKMYAILKRALQSSTQRYASESCNDGCLNHWPMHSAMTATVCRRAKCTRIQHKHNATLKIKHDGGRNHWSKRDAPQPSNTRHHQRASAQCHDSMPPLRGDTWATCAKAMQPPISQLPTSGRGLGGHDFCLFSKAASWASPIRIFRF